MQDENKNAEPAEEITRLEEITRRIVQEERRQWEAACRKRKKRILLAAGIVLLLLVTAVLLWVFLKPQSDPADMPAATEPTEDTTPEPESTPTEAPTTPPAILDEEAIQALSPIDAQAAAEIDAMEGYDPEDTWTFYLYLVGSDLEAGTSNQLSSLVQSMLKNETNQIRQSQSALSQEWMLQLNEDLVAQGAELPYCLYAPQSDLNLTTDTGSDTPPYVQGDASTDLYEYMSVVLPENVRFVIQTGGATAWSNPDINPNRTQRFLLDSEGLQEISNAPLSNMGDPDTLADFLKFCDKEYPADHQVVILWNHGGGSRGFGVDQIFSNDLLTLSELKEAFSAAFPLDPENPPLEMIYFACCLMSNAETLHYLDGTAKYLVAAEEVTYTMPNACQGWLEQFVQDTGINGAQLGKLIVDSYMDAVLAYAAQSGTVFPTTMNLLDMRRAGDIYDAYGDFAQAALKAQIQDPAMISAVADSAASSVFFSLTGYHTSNLIDLPLFMESAAQYFPEEAGAVLEAVEDVMLYKRATTYLKDAGGVSIYYPYHLRSNASILTCLEYLNLIGTNMDINAMYYYKMTGCLNDTYQQHCIDSGYGSAELLPYSQLYRLRNGEVEFDDTGSMRLTLTPQENLLVQDALYELVRVEEDTIIHLGADRYVDAETEQLLAQFPGSWIMIDDVPFALEVINTDDENIQYRSPVIYDSKHMDLILNYNYETQAVTVLGVREETYVAATLDRSAEALEYGKTIVPLYLASGLNGSNVAITEGAEVCYTQQSVISDATLPDGIYIARIKLTDMRGDVYQSLPIRITWEDGLVTEAVPETEYILPKT